jgi:hypothetical protein
MAGCPEKWISGCKTSCRLQFSTGTASVEFTCRGGEHVFHRSHTSLPQPLNKYLMSN